MTAPTKAQLTEQLAALHVLRDAACVQVAQLEGLLDCSTALVEHLTTERDAMLVEQRPSRGRRSATAEQIAAHNTYRETLSAARELAIRTGKSVLVTNRG